MTTMDIMMAMALDLIGLEEVSILDTGSEVTLYTYK